MTEMIKAGPGRLWGEALGLAAAYFLALLIIPIIGTVAYGFYLAAQGQSLDPTDFDLVAKITFLALPVVSIVVLLIIHLLLKKRKMAWKNMGLAKPESIPKAFFIGLGVFVVSAVVSLLVNMGMSELGYEQDLEIFGFLPGDTVMYIYLITVISWFSAGFVEEFAFRGFIMGNIAKALGDNDKAWILAAIIQAMIFGLFHAYQGFNGIMATGSIALVFGLFYFKIRNLWPIIFAHGLIDVVGITALYYGVDFTV